MLVEHQLQIVGETELKRLAGKLIEKDVVDEINVHDNGQSDRSPMATIQAMISCLSIRQR
jgi:hypothetical protein